MATITNISYKARCQLGFLGHILLLSVEEPARSYALYIPSHGKKESGRPWISYLAYIQGVLGYDENEKEKTAEEVGTLAKDRCA